MKTTLKRSILAISVAGLMGLVVSPVYASKNPNNRERVSPNIDKQLDGIHYVCYKIAPAKDRGQDSNRARDDNTNKDNRVAVKLITQFTRDNNGFQNADYYYVQEAEQLCVPAIKHECGKRDNKNIRTSRGANVCRDDNGVTTETPN